MPSWSSLAIILIVLLLMELVVEQKLRPRRRLLSLFGRRIWLGGLTVIAGAISIVLALDEILIPRWPELQDHDLYKYAKLAFIVYFLPKKYDRDERLRSDADKVTT